MYDVGVGTETADKWEEERKNRGRHARKEMVRLPPRRFALLLACRGDGADDGTGPARTAFRVARPQDG